MKAHYKLNDNITIEVEAEELKKLLEEMTEIHESIGIESCGKCNNPLTMPRVRQIEDNKFYEMVCKKCGAFLSLGISKDSGKLYKKRLAVNSKGKAEKDENGKAVMLNNRGWGKYNPETKKIEY